MEENSSRSFSDKKWYFLGLPGTFRKIIWTSALVVTGLCILDLFGWILNISYFKSLIPEWQAMKAITSICLISSTAALLLIRLNLPVIMRSTLSAILASLIIIVSLLTLFDYLRIIEAGHEPTFKGFLYLKFIIAPEYRMAMLTSYNFLITGVVILLLLSGKKRTSGLAHILIFSVILITYYTVVSYILGVYNATQFQNVSVAMNTGIAFLGICMIVLSIEPDTWVLKAYTSNQIGGVIARRLLPILMVLPVIIGWIRIEGERIGLFESDQGVIYVAMAYSVSFLILIWLTARYVNNIDNKRRISEEALRASEQRLKFHFENSPLAVVEWDSDYIIINWSIEAVHIFGYEKAAVLGKRIDSLNLIFEDDIPIVRAAMERLSGGKELKVISENRNYTRKKEIINCIWYNSVLLDEHGHMSSVMSLVEDVTVRRRIEQKIIERTNELESANNKLTELNATKDKFFNIVAHDLKNPFTSLMGSSELLYENIHSMSPENIKKLATILNDSAKGGYSILQNLLDWSRSQTGLLKISPQKINLKSIVNENIYNLQLPAANKQITLKNESEEDIYTLTDKNMINTILRNLISNAIKFTRKGGNVTVNIITETDKFIIQVKDNGIGISPEKIEKLFNLETKHTEPGTEKEQGTGLGLKLCKEFAEKLGGTISVESKDGKGSTFSFTIPDNHSNKP